MGGLQKPYGKASSGPMREVRRAGGWRQIKKPRRRVTGRRGFWFGAPPRQCRRNIEFKTDNTLTCEGTIAAVVNSTFMRPGGVKWSEANKDLMRERSALGKTKIAPEEIARALDLPVSAVEQSVSALQRKGLKVIQHG
jgi:hypothetical protein